MFFLLMSMPICSCLFGDGFADTMAIGASMSNGDSSDDGVVEIGGVPISAVPEVHRDRSTPCSGKTPNRSWSGRKAKS
jgi:hypothetical protein